jgi:hypothetical protein
MKYNANKNRDKAIKSKFPSECGSHKVMLDDKYVEINEDDSVFVICKDDRGSYVTERGTLDSGLADYNRWANIDRREAGVKCLLALKEIRHEKEKEVEPA